jgi:hypothetical protein
MSDTGKFKLPEKPPELDKHEEGSGSSHGRIRFDDLGNAVWEPHTGLGSADTVRVLLEDSVLAVSEDDSKGTLQRVQPNPTGLKKGYDPYDSGLLAQKGNKKQKDLRALSKWIETKKKLGRDP